MRRRMDTTPVTFEAFAKAYECILECVEDEFGKWKKNLTADDLKRVVAIHKALVNRGLHLSRIGYLHLILLHHFT